MKILLVNPPRYRGLPVIREERCEIIEGSSILVPYSLLQMGSLIKDKADEIKLIDANALNFDYCELEKKMEETDYDILIFKFTPTSFKEDIKTAQISKKAKPKAITIGACYSLSKISEKVMSEATDMDIYLRHEFEVVTPDLIGNIKNLPKVDGIAYRDGKNIIINKDAKPIEDYDSLPIPAFDLLPSFDPYFISVNHGKPFTIVYTSKGCPFNCIYCNASNTKLKIKSIDRIMKEIEYLKKNYNIKTISFYDETFTIDQERVLEFCERIKKYKIKWYCNTRTSLVTLDLLKKMNEAGCKAISFGIESGSQKVLDIASKGITVQGNLNAIKWAATAGIKTHCSFIIGLPGETKETIKEMFEFLRKSIPNSVEFNIATPYPGTRFYDYAIKNKWIDKDIDWHMLYQDIAFYKNRELSNDYLESIRKKLHYSVYFNPRWFFKNLFYLLRNPDDFVLASRYLIKIIKDSMNHFNIVVDKK